jgi:hypothetical protein
MLSLGEPLRRALPIPLFMLEHGPEVPRVVQIPP